MFIVIKTNKTINFSFILYIRNSFLKDKINLKGRLKIMRKKRVLISILCASATLLMLCACGNNKNEIEIESWKDDTVVNTPSKSQEPVRVEVGEDETWFISFDGNEDSIKDHLGNQETNKEKEEEEEVDKPTLESSITIEQVNPTNDNTSIENNNEDSNGTTTP